MKSKGRFECNTYLTRQFSNKLERLVAEVGSASYDPERRRLVINEEANFFAGVSEALQISRQCFLKQLKMMGFRRHSNEGLVEYRWRNRQRFNLEKEMNVLSATLKQQNESRKHLLQSVSQKKKQIDQLLEDMIFRLLVRGAVGK